MKGVVTLSAAKGFAKLGLWTCVPCEVLRFAQNDRIGALLFALLVTGSAAAAPVKIVVNGREVETSVIETNGAIYVPVAQNPWSFGALLVRPSTGSAQALAPSVRAAIARVECPWERPTTSRIA